MIHFEIDKFSFKKETSNSWVFTIGNFDGVHLGHQALIKTVVDEAKKLNANAGLITFYPHPKTVLHPDKIYSRIYSHEEKRRYVSEYSLAAAYNIHFTQAFSLLSPQEFIENCLLNKFNIKKIIVGYNFSFGKDKTGSTKELVNILDQNNIEILIFPPYLVESQIVSSSLIRKLLSNCEFKKVSTFLNRRWSISGQVVSRNNRGTEIGFPTANIEIKDTLSLPIGVYACEVLLNKMTYQGIMNYGYSPTFGQSQLTAEVHLLNFNQDIYQSQIEIYPMHFIREERKFISSQELIEQIKQDIIECKNLVSAI